MAKFDPVNNVMHWTIAMGLAALTGLASAYSIITVMCWDIDNQNSTSVVTLAHWIYVNQIQHVWRMLHEIW